ncbi:hypothetical protein [Streptomyces europaeiscabiei]|uniref:hypothetical protein n=1 Tax=Streptomyces europaeiscabiei TaxID=146819 RepID=UPI002E1223A9|nr:hypothetical protein OHB30_50610 [Streptomyces europaeiscabiei]
MDHDRYAHALEQLVDAVVAGAELAEPPQPEPAVDLMTALQQSVEEARSARRASLPSDEEQGVLVVAAQGCDSVVHADASLGTGEVAC